MKKILRLWFVLAVAIGTMCTSIQAMDPEEESDKPAAAASATRGYSATRGSSYQVVQNDVASGVNAHNVVNPKNTLGNTDLATGDKSAAAASVTGMDGLHLSDSHESPDQEKGKQLSDLEQLPQELFNNIVNLLDPKSIESLSKTSITCQTKVYEFDPSHLVQALGDESRRGLQVPTGRGVPNMGLALFDSEAPGSRIIEALKKMVSLLTH